MYKSLSTFFSFLIGIEMRENSREKIISKIGRKKRKTKKIFSSTDCFMPSTYKKEEKSKKNDERIGMRRKFFRH